MTFLSCRLASSSRELLSLHIFLFFLRLRAIFLSLGPWSLSLSLLLSLISSLVFILSLARLCATEDVLSTEHTPGLLYNQITAHTHMRTSTRTEAHVQRNTQNLHFQTLWNDTGVPTEPNKHSSATPKQILNEKRKRSRVISPEGSNSSGLHSCALQCTDRWQPRLIFRSAQTEE